MVEPKELRTKSALVAMISVMFVIGAVWFTNRSVDPPKATWEDVEREAKQGGYRLINTDELHRLYRDEKESLLVVDTRQEWEFRAGHVKGAVNFPMETTAWARWWEKGALKNFLGENRSRKIVFY